MNSDYEKSQELPELDSEESQELPNFEEYSNQMLLPRAGTHLQDMMGMEQIDENLRNRLMDIFQESLRRAQFDVSHGYRRLQESAPLLNRDSSQNVPHGVSGRREQQGETNPSPFTIEPTHSVPHGVPGPREQQGGTSQSPFTIESTQYVPYTMHEPIEQQQQETNPSPSTIEDSSTREEDSASTHTVVPQQSNNDTSITATPRVHDSSLRKPRTDHKVATVCTECHSTKPPAGYSQGELGDT